MSRKPTKMAKPEAERIPRKAVPLILKKGDSEEVAARKYAMLVTSPELAACRAISASEVKTVIGEDIDVPSLMEQLRVEAVAVNRGDLSQAEAMLINQATALQSLFARLAERAMSHDQIPGFDANMRMALRSQSQCRATLETLAAIKNPPIVYAKQANFAAGHQQVNNAMPGPTQAREIENQQSKLSEVNHELLPDARTSCSECSKVPIAPALGEINRAEND